MKFLSILLICTFLFSSNTFKYTNLLINSHSPYLLQHAHNPVDWFVWGDEALSKAKEENKLIFLSIGYSTCHWCHVMEEKSFENEEIAKLLNQDFISIKVDKEQMPHIDSHFQHTLTLIKEKRKGWPLSAILTPNEEILYITTYIPPTNKYGVDGMKTLLPKLSKLWSTDKLRVRKIIKTNKDIVSRKSLVTTSKISKDKIAQNYVALMKKRYDTDFQGFDLSPKFPLATHMNTLLDIYLMSKDSDALNMLKGSIEAMSKSGLYDHVEGGFFRYSVEADWVTPHFEKMLYTQAELISLYVKFYILFPSERYKRIVLDTLEQTNKRLGYEGLYFSASDADSINGEGRYFVYSYEETKDAFKKKNIKNIDEVMEYLDITEIGNFQDELSNVHMNTDFKKVPKNVDVALGVLKNMRDKRDFPFVDKKVLTGWNSLMIKSVFDASYFDEKFIKKAEKSLKTLLDKVYIRGTLYHGFLAGQKPKDLALLEDYVYLTDLLQSAYMHTYNKAYLQIAGNLLNETLSKFYKNKKFYLDNTQFKAIAGYEDKYYVSPLSRLYHVLFTQANLTYDLKLLEKTRGFLKDERDKILKRPDYAPEALRALLRSNRGDVIIKSNKKNLLKKQRDILHIKTPFVLRTLEQTEKYLACDEQTCFAVDDKFDDIIKKIITH